MHINDYAVMSYLDMAIDDSLLIRSSLAKMDYKEKHKPK